MEVAAFGLDLAKRTFAAVAGPERLCGQGRVENQ